MANKYGKDLSEVLFDNFVGKPNPSEVRSKILEEPKLISQENTTIKSDIDTDLGVSDSNIDGVVGYKDLRVWFGKYSNDTKSFIAITDIKDRLLTTTPNKKVIDKIEIANTQVDLPLIKFLQVTEDGELYGIWNYNSKIHFFRLVQFTDTIGNPSLVSIYPIVNTDVETTGTAPNGVPKGYAKFTNYDLIDITRDEQLNGLFSFAIWKNDGRNDRKIRFILLDTNDLANITWEKNEDVNPSHVEGTLGTDFNGVSSLAIKTNKYKFDNAQQNDDNKILGSIWFATKTGSTTTTPKTFKVTEKVDDLPFDEIRFFHPSEFFDGEKKIEPITASGNVDAIQKAIDKVNKIKNDPSITNFKIKQIYMFSNVEIKHQKGQFDFGTTTDNLYRNINITDQPTIDKIMDGNNYKPSMYMRFWKVSRAGQTIFDRQQIAIGGWLQTAFEDQPSPITNGIYYMGDNQTQINRSFPFGLKTKFNFNIEYEYTKNITVAAINSASQLLMSARDDKKQDTLFYDLAQNISNPIFDSNKPKPFNYLNAYYPVKTNSTWQIWDFNGKRGTNYDTPSTATIVNDKSIWPDGNLVINSILDNDFGTSIVGVGSDQATGVQGGSIGLNIYDGDGNGVALGVSETIDNEFQKVNYIVGNREKDLMFWSAFNDDFSKKLNYMQIYPNSLSPYTLTPYKDYLQSTVVDRISIRDTEEFIGTKFDRAITNSNVSNNVLSVTTIATSEDLNDNDNDTLILFSKSNKEVVVIPTTSYQMKNRTEEIEINVSTTFKYNINGVTQNTPSVALARLHQNVKQEDLDHLQITKGVISFDDDTTKGFDPFNDTTWEVFPNEITGQTTLLIRFGLVQTDVSKKATKVQIFSKENDLLNEVDLTQVPCTQTDWTDKLITIELSTTVEI